MRGRLGGSPGMIGLHAGEAVVGRRVDDDQSKSGRQIGRADECGGLVDDDHTVHALLVESLERFGRVSGAQSDDGNVVLAFGGGIGHGFEHERVADGRERRDDDADRAGSPGPQRPAARWMR